MKKTSLLFLLLMGAASLGAAEFRLLSFVDYYGRIEPNDSYDSIRTRLHAQPSLQTSLFGNRADLTLSANLWYQPVGEERFVAPENILREFYLTLPLGRFDLTLGQKFETFGFADVFSPLNKINGADSSILSLDDGVDSPRADGMVQLQFYPSYDDTLELIYIPFPRPDYSPEDRAFLEDADRQVKLAFDGSPYLTDNAHSLYFRYYRFSERFDFQFVYAWYKDRTPGFDFSELNDGGAVLTGTAEAVYSRNHLLGLGISLPLGATVIAEDLAFNLSEDADGSDIGVRNSSITANTQFTRSLWGTFAQLNVIYQYFLQYDEHEDDYGSPLYDDVIDEMKDYHIQPREHIAFMVAHLHRYFFREKLYLVLNTGFFFSTNMYLGPRVSYAFSDRTHLEVGADINTGPPSKNDLLRSDDRDNFFLRLKYEY